MKVLPCLICVNRETKKFCADLDTSYEFEPVYRSIELSCGLQIEPK